jgi:hypothetical protein
LPRRHRQAGKAAQETNMNLILWCVTGALIALLASLRTPDGSARR